MKGATRGNPRVGGVKGGAARGNGLRAELI